MNTVAHLMDSWAAAMWRASWQAAVAVAVVWSICRLAPSIPARFQAWLWRLVVLKFMVALLWTVPVEVPLLPAPTLSAATLATVEAGEANLSSSIPAETTPVAQYQPSSIATPWLIPFLAWIALVGWQAARILTACGDANRLRSDCRQSEDQLLIAELARLSKSVGLGSPPALLETDGQGSPLLLGILRPAIVLPVTTLKRLDAPERALVIGHELAHVRRADLFWSVFAAAVRGVFFFHPLAWLCERQLRMAQEIAADELAIGLQKHDPVSYATVLVSVVSKLGPARRIPAMSVGMAGSHQSLQQRFSAMRFMKPVSRPGVVAYGIVLGMVAFLGVVPWVLVAAEPAAADKPSAAYILRSKEGITVRGEFVSFKGDLLKIKGDGEVNKGNEIGIKVAGNIKVVGLIKGIKVESTGPEAFKVWEPGAAIAVRVEDGMARFVEIGSKKAADAPAADKPRPADKPPTPAKATSQKEKTLHGRFVSFKDGVLRIKGYDETKFDGIKVADNTKVLSIIEGKEVNGSAPEAFKRWEPGAEIVVQLDDGKVTLVRIKPTDKAPDRVPEKATDKQIRLQPGPVPDKAPEKKSEKESDKVGQKTKMEWGRFVSLNDGTLTIQANSGALLVNKIPENATTLVWNNSADKYMPADTAGALNDVKVGTLVVVNVAKDSFTLRIGSRKGQTVGTFVSFKDNRLLLLGKNLGESFTKKYGNNLQFSGIL